MRLPWYHRVVAVLAVLWHLLGAVDYLATKLGVGVYLSFFTPEQIAYFTSLPLAANLGWALGTWAGLFGALVLWSGEGRAAGAFAVSFGGWMLATAWLAFLTEPPLRAVTGEIGVSAMLASVAVALGLFLYARWLRARQRASR